MGARSARGAALSQVVVDASAVVDLLSGSWRAGPVARLLRGSVPSTVAHMDAEAFRAFARMARAGVISADDVDRALTTLGRAPWPRLPITGRLTRRAWELRDAIAARDALYVAAAEVLDARLLTTDDRLARTIGDRAVSLGD